MKLPLLSFVTALALVVGLSAPSALHADEFNPMFAGTSLDINGETYTWDSASEDSTWHDDVYTGSGGTVVVRGMVGFPNLATVGWQSGGEFGHVSNQTYGDNYWESGAGGYGSWETYEYTVDFVLGELYWMHQTSDNDGWGNEWSSWQDSHEEWGTWSRSYYDDYSGNSGMNETWDSSAFGPGSHIFAHSVSQSGSAITLFGIQFDWQSGSSWTDTRSGQLWSETAPDEFDRGGGSASYNINDSSVEVSYEYDLPSQPALTTITGTDPYIGSFQGTVSGAPGSPSSATFAPRTAPTFAGSQLWIDGWLVSWQGGTLSGDGYVVDVYSNDYLNMSITGNVRSYKQGTAGAGSVEIEGDTVGTVTFAGPSSPPTWGVAGWTVSAATEFNTSGAPYFLDGVTTLWVDGVPYAFTQGYSDGAGSYLDLYVNVTVGTLRLNGPDANSVTVKGNKQGTFFEGSLASGQFELSEGVTVSLTAPPPSFIPGRLWVRGVYYGQPVLDAEGLPTNTFTDYFTQTQPEGGGDPVSVPTHVVSYTEGSSGEWQISGTYPDGEASVQFTGTLTSLPTCLFMLSGPEGVGYPAMAVGADGKFTGIGSTQSDPNMPKAVVLDGTVLEYLGIASNDAAPGQVAWYGKSQAGTSTQMLKLGAGTIYSVTLATYPTGTTKAGTYDPADLLFQTHPTTNTLPGPLYPSIAVASNEREPKDSGDLPQSFIVRGKAWWFTGYDGAKAIYQGFYEGQIMKLGLPEGDDLVRLVELTDEPHNGNNTITQGSLSGVRGSVRLRDGTVVVSGSLNGVVLDVSVAAGQNLSLQTINADLDILGNSLSFGILTGNANLAGAAWWFQDRDSISTLHSAVSRPQAEWAWWKAGQDQEDDMQPVMRLDNTNRLSLFPTGGNRETPAGITLDPAGASSFMGPVRVLPAGDLPMAEEFQGGPRP
jgi:hypothetical protein